jgi:nicotinamidase-related amidase
MVGAARDAGIPVVFFQEVHRRSLEDFGRVLGGVETEHGLDGDEATELDDRLLPQEGDDLIVKPRYSCFFGTELEILL